MISYLKGNVVDTSLTSVILDVNDIGYEIIMSDGDICELRTVSDKVLIYTYMQVREDSLTLFGFLKKSDLDIFNNLCEVNGIGAKIAMNIFSKTNIDDFVEALENGDIATLIKCPGIGKKTAQRMILELKGKLIIEKDVNNKVDITSCMNEAIEGLTNLGFSKQEVLSKMKNIENVDNKSTEDIIKEVLRMK